MQFIKKHFLKIIIIVLVAFFIVFLFIKGKEKKAASFERYTVTQRDIVEEVAIGGRIRTANRAKLAFNRSGRVDTILVREGQKVKKGQQLARVEMGQLYAELKSAQATLDIAKADVQSAHIDLEKVRREQEIFVDNAHRALLNNDLQAYSNDANDKSAPPIITGTYTGDSEGIYSIDIYGSSTDSGISFRLSGLESGTYSAYTTLPGNLGLKGLYIRFDPYSNYRNEIWTVPIPNTRSASYTMALNAYQSAVATAERTIAAAENTLNASGGDQTRAQAQVAQAQARINSIYAQINDGTITAPFDGVIGSIEIEKGENALAGNSVMTLIGEEHYEMILNVPEIDIAKVTIGDLVDITLDAYTDIHWEGEITSINAAETFVEGVPVYETTVLIITPDERVHSGMSGQATIITGEQKNALAIPARALSRTGRDIYTVTVLDENEKTSTLEVTPGLRGNDSFVEIIQGLSLGDTIIMDAQAE